MKKNRKKRPGRQAASLAGTGLSLDPRRGIYYWRGTDPLTKKRVMRSTGTGLLELATRKAAEFEEKRERKRVGLQDIDCWGIEIAPLVEPFVESIDAGEPVRKHMRKAVTRALEELKLVRAADLDNVGALHDRLMALARAQELPATMVRRCFQDPLRRFSRWLAGNKRHLDRDPLASWEPIKAPKGKGRHKRAVMPDEMARALLAADVLDRINGRAHSSRLAYLMALVAAPRAGALVALDVGSLDQERSRVDLGEDHGCKRKGTGALDKATLEDLVAALGEREDGPLLLSPAGGRWQTNRLLDTYREAFSLGTVDRLWPEDAPRDLELAAQVSATLLAGKARVSRGGNPKRIKPSTWARLDARAREVNTIAAEIRQEWEKGMYGVLLHGLRKTHRTWALASGVLPAAVDKQLGHATQDPAEAFEILRVTAGSRVGRQHYLDAASPLFDPRESAAAVRGLLDQALANLEQGGESLLVACRLACGPQEARA